MINDLEKAVVAFIGGCLVFGLLLGRLGEKETPVVNNERAASAAVAPRKGAPAAESSRDADLGVSPEDLAAGLPETSAPESVYNPYSDDVLRQGLTAVFGEEGSTEREERLRVYREGRFNRYREQAAASVPQADVANVFASMTSAAEGTHPTDAANSGAAPNPYSSLELREPKTPTYFENAARSRGE